MEPEEPTEHKCWDHVTCRLQWLAPVSRATYCTTTAALSVPTGRAFADTTPAKAQMDDAEDRDGYERVWPSEVAKQVADLSTCQRIAKALGVKLAGSTTFCPVNWVSHAVDGKGTPWSA